MHNSFYSYLDAFDELTIIVPKDEYHPNTKYSLEGNDEIIPLEIIEVTNIGDEEKIIATFDAYVNLEIPYSVISDDGNRSELFMGKVVRTSLFDSIYYYRKDDLGFTYTKESTKFKIWSPIAKQVLIELVSPSGDVKTKNLFYKSQGVWRVEESGDLEGYKYRYKVYVNGKMKICQDPYAISSDENNNYSYVIDKDKLYKMTYPQKECKSVVDAVIYETSFRDFTSYFKKDDNRSTYNKFYQEGLRSKDNNPICFDYLKSLGITHVQLMPFFLFGDVDENNRLKSYNWGYNPVSFNTPSGIYSTDASSPYDRINELKKCIDMIHKAGLGVVMDVVYNHVFAPDTFPYEILCPGYIYIYNREGIRTNYSGCKDDVNSSKKMIRKFILDSILYWAKEYKIDGFRMDLMGILDFETVNDVALELKDLNPNIILYGEGWKMISSNTADSLAHMYNKNVISSVGFFNDRFRENIRAYSKGSVDNLSIVREVLLGSVANRFLFKYTNQTINYVECHDDLTMYDYMMIDKTMDESEAKKRCLLALSMTILSSGVPFIHSGEEFYRSKDFISNSYNKPDEINMINWDNVDKNIQDINFVKELIKIRKEYQEFHLITSTDVSEREKVEFTSLGTAIFILTLSNEIAVIFKNNPQKEDVDLSSYKVLLSNLEYDDKSLKGIGTMVLLKE